MVRGLWYEEPIVGAERDCAVPSTSHRHSRLKLSKIANFSSPESLTTTALER
jgi:hypothetical protein